MNEAEWSEKNKTATADEWARQANEEWFSMHWGQVPVSYERHVFFTNGHYRLIPGFITRLESELDIEVLEQGTFPKEGPSEGYTVALFLGPCAGDYEDEIQEIWDKTHADWVVEGQANQPN